MPFFPKFTPVFTHFKGGNCFDLQSTGIGLKVPMSFFLVLRYPALPLIGKSWPSLERTIKEFLMSRIRQMTRWFIHSKLGQNFPIRGSAWYYYDVYITKLTNFRPNNRVGTSRECLINLFTFPLFKGILP